VICVKKSDHGEKIGKIGWVCQDCLDQRGDSESFCLPNGQGGLYPDGTVVHVGSFGGSDF